MLPKTYWQVTLKTILVLIISFSVDPVISIYTSVLRIIEIEMEYLKNQAMSAFSPGLAATLLWFQKRFVRSYLLLNDTTQLKLSPTLSACFYLKNDCGKLVLKLLLEVIEINLLAWSGEPLVGEDTVKLLLRLLADNKRLVIFLSQKQRRTIIPGPVKNILRYFYCRVTFYQDTKQKHCVIWNNFWERFEKIRLIELK